MIARQPEIDRPLNFGTRGSALALVQTELVIGRFQTVYPEHKVDVRIVKTEGDIDKTSPLTSIGGRGVFTNAIESAVLDGSIDAAVHSAKDLPSRLDPRAPIVAYPIRDDPRDVLVSRHGTTLDRLPPCPVIGTSSRRREVQILRLRPDARIVNLRGNIDTRLRKAERPELDAIVLAAAGLLRMGWQDRVAQVFSIEEMVPSPAQGALAVQSLAESQAATLLQSIDDPEHARPVGIERSFLAEVGAGCTFPVGAYAELVGGSYRLVAMLASADGARIAFADERLHAGDERARIAEIVAGLRGQVGMSGGARTWTGWPANGGELRGARIVVTRPQPQAEPLITALTARGAKPLSMPTLRIEPLGEAQEVIDACDGVRHGAFDWIVFTSANAADVFGARLKALGIGPEEFAPVNAAAVGHATAAAARAAGFQVRLVPTIATAESLAEELLAVLPPGARVVYPCSAIGRDVLPKALRAAGIEVSTVPVYRTVQSTDADSEVLGDVRRGEVDLIAFSSPSSVRNLVTLLGEDRSALHRIPVVSAGPVTASAASEAGFVAVSVSDDPGVTAMVNAIADIWRERAQTGGPRKPIDRNDFAAMAIERSAG